MKEQLQPSHDTLLAAAKQCGNLMGTQKTMTVNEPDDVTVAVRQLYERNRVNAFETRRAGSFHPATMRRMEEMGETAELATYGKRASIFHEPD